MGMAVPFDCIYTHKYNRPELSSSPEAQLAFTAAPTPLQHCLGITTEIVPRSAAPNPHLALLGRGGLRATCHNGQLAGHDLSPYPDPACFSDSL